MEGNVKKTFKILIHFLIPTKTPNRSLAVVLFLLTWNAKSLHEKKSRPPRVHRIRFVENALVRADLTSPKNIKGVNTRFKCKRFL